MKKMLFAISILMIINRLLYAEDTWFTKQQLSDMGWKATLIDGPSAGYDYPFTTMDASSRIRNNDGTLRIYAGCADTKVYEFDWNKTISSWNKHQIAVGQAGNSAWFPPVPIHLTICSGRNDDMNNEYIYFGDLDSIIYESVFTGGIFDTRAIILPAGVQQLLISFLFSPKNIGEANQSNPIYLFYSREINRSDPKAFMQPMEEYKWNGATWEITGLFESVNCDVMSSSVNEICAGEGRGDGKIRIYGGECCVQGLYEFEQTGSSWKKVMTIDDIFLQMTMNNSSLFISNLKNTKPALYVSALDGIYEYSWNNNRKFYKKTKITDIPHNAIIGCAIEKDDPDSLKSLYAEYESPDTIEIHEFSWIESAKSWQRTWNLKLDKQSFISSIRIGAVQFKKYNARNDEYNRLYLINEEGYLYEFSFPPKKIRPEVDKNGEPKLGADGKEYKNTIPTVMKIRNKPSIIGR